MAQLQWGCAILRLPTQFFREEVSASATLARVVHGLR